MTFEVGDMVRHLGEGSAELHAARGPFQVTDVRNVRKGFTSDPVPQIRAEDPNDARVFVVGPPSMFEKVEE